MPDLTISLNPAQAQRVADALGKRLNLTTDTVPPVPRAATMAEAREFIVGLLRGVVREEELRAVVIPDLM